MFRKLVLLIGGVALTGSGLLLVGGQPARAGSPAAGGIFYESQPDEVALYLSDIAFVRDELVLPTGQGEVRVLLPPGVYPNTLLLTENGERVHHYRVTPQSTDIYATSSLYSSSSVPMSGAAYMLSWQPAPASGENMTSTVKLEYLLSGASWSPVYDMAVVDDQTVDLAFFAEIRNSALVMEQARVYLVAGRVDLGQQVDQVSMVTMNQYAVGYANEPVALPDLGAGLVTLQHIYTPEPITAKPGDTVFANLVDATFSARRLLVWNAAIEQEVDVIYKVKNDGDLPLAEGIVRVYQDNLFMGSDFIETTPVGSEGSVTVGSLPDVRVRRTESQEYVGGIVDDYYQHSVELEINNYNPDTLELIVLDGWRADAWEFEYSLEPQRQQDNILRWEVSIKSGDSLKITYRFRTDA